LDSQSSNSNFSHPDKPDSSSNQGKRQLTLLQCLLRIHQLLLLLLLLIIPTRLIALLALLIALRISLINRLLVGTLLVRAGDR
jgi:hypothetical protein